MTWITSVKSRELITFTPKGSSSVKAVTALNNEKHFSIHLVGNKEFFKQSTMLLAGEDFDQEQQLFIDELNYGYSLTVTKAQKAILTKFMAIVQQIIPELALLQKELALFWQFDTSIDIKKLLQELSKEDTATAIATARRLEQEGFQNALTELASNFLSLGKEQAARQALSLITSDNTMGHFLASKIYGEIANADK